VDAFLNRWLVEKFVDLVEKVGSAHVLASGGLAL